MEKAFDFKSRKIFLITVIIQIAIISLISLDFIGIRSFHILRELVGFIYLMFIPGLVLIQLLNLGKIEFTRFILFVVGLSISFLMFFGLIFDQILIFFNYMTPLATAPLLGVFSILFLSLSFFTYKKNFFTGFKIPNFNFKELKKSKVQLLILILLIMPFLSILGTNMLNYYNNNIILMLLLIIIASCVIIFSFIKFPRFFYPLTIFIISFSILMMGALRSSHIIGIDIHNEFYVFTQTMSNLRWQFVGYSTFDACLSITILPTIYVSILGINSEFLFKVLYSLFFIFSPLIIYKISQQYLGDKYAFLATIVFISQVTFFSTYGNSRTSLGILLFGLSFLAMFSNEISIIKKRILFIIFMIGCVLSHYSTTYIFLWLLIFAFIILTLSSKILNIKIKEKFSYEIVFLLFALIILWYSQIIGSPFDSSLDVIKNTFLNLQNFFDMETKSGVPALLGSGIEEKGIPHKLEFVLTWSVLGLIGFGIINLIFKFRYMSFPEIGNKKVKFLIRKFESNYFALVVGCAVVLFNFVFLPTISGAYSIDRTYAVTSILLAPIFIIGVIFLSDYLKKVKININPIYIFLMILIPYFLLVSGFAYNLFGYDRSILLNSHGNDYDTHFVHDHEFTAIKWIVDKGNTKQIAASDYIGALRLSSIGNFNPDFIDKYSLGQNRIPKGLFYLRYFNVINKKIYVNGTLQDILKFEDKINVKNEIYDNGGSRFYL